MRRLLLAAAVCGAAMSGARAADLSDLPILRGPVGLSSSRVNWAGVYLGGQAARGVADMNFTNSAQDLLAKLLNSVDLEQQFNISQWPLLGKSHASGTGYGAFAGYNFQWTDALIGVEMNYTHGTFFGSSSGSQARSFNFPANYFSTAVASSSASMRITDYGSLRVRGGYAVGSFLPYAFAGVALGQADINRDAAVTLQYIYVGPPTTPLPNIGPVTSTLSDHANSHFISGWSGGLGIDYMVYQCLFLRAEWEYLHFASTVDTTVNTLRVGVGYKF
jgi:opacity protein-like surface antigen